HQEIKYDELNRKANQLARHLRNIGIGPDKTVGVFIDRSPELVVSILGILKAGGAYVPLDTKYPKQRLAFMVEDAQISVIIAKSWLTHSLPEQGFHAVCIDLDKEMIERQGDTNLAAETAAENLAYMIYSSGSTGIPKAIAIRHGGIVNNVIDLNSRFKLGPEDRMIALSSLSFDMSVYEILGTLAAGAAIVLPKEQWLGDPGHWVELGLKHEVTVWDSAPTLLEAAVNYWTRHEEFRPQSLRLAILGGDWVPIILPDRLKALVDGVRVETTGGATEASVFSIIYTV